MQAEDRHRTAVSPRIGIRAVPRIDFALPRLHVEAPLEPGSSVNLGREQSHYLANVLRLGPGSTILVFNGRDGEWRASLGGARATSLRLVERTRPQPPASPILYGFAPLKHARLDYLVQKAVEMGAGTLQPVLTRRTQISRVNLERMRANVIEAAEQCGVLSVPAVCEPLKFVDFVASWDANALMIVCDEDADVLDPIDALRQAALRSGGPIGIAIGPEGGFDPVERDALLALPRHVRLSLGPRILRADTAAVAALALVQAVLGDGAGTVAVQKIGMPPATTTMAPDV